jgi:hypothetical protein
MNETPYEGFKRVEAMQKARVVSGADQVRNGSLITVVWTTDACEAYISTKGRLDKGIMPNAVATGCPDADGFVHFVHKTGDASTATVTR